MDDCALTTDSKLAASTGLRRTLGLARPERGWLQWLRDPHFALAALAAVPVWIALGRLVGERMQVDLALTALLSLAVVQPVVEELVFRGALQGRLLERGWTRRIGPVSSANLGTTAAFVVLHFMAQPPAWAIAVAAPSLVFGHLRERFGSVLPAIALHFIYNAGFAATAWRVHH
jgi:membrane protease YdiL (CAAX protease family)